MYVLAKVIKANQTPAYIYYCTETETRSSIRTSILNALTQGLDMPDLNFYKGFKQMHVTNPNFSVPLVKSSKPICPENYPELFV